MLLTSLFKRRKKRREKIEGQVTREAGKHDKELNISFFGGKGGVGKTTCSTVFALSLAEQGVRTLLVSTDPAHSLLDLLAIDVRSKHTINEIAPNLWIQEIDAVLAGERYIQEVKQNLEQLTAPELRKEVNRQLDFAKTSPGADEAALFDEWVKIILDSVNQFDHIVFDTAPTGHTLRLLSLPELMEVWLDGMLSQRRKSQDMNRMLSNIAGVREDEPVDQVYNILQRRKHRFSLVKEKLLNPDYTSFYFVLNPERLPIMETEKALHTLNQYGIPVGGLMINRVLPDEADGEFLERRREQEQEYLTEIKERFNQLKKIYIPMQPTDVKGLTEIKALTRYFIQ